MDIESYARMVAQVNRSFATYARSMMDASPEIQESNIFGHLVDIDKECTKLAEGMEGVADYVKMWHSDSPKTAKWNEAFKGFFGTEPTTADGATTAEIPTETSAE